MLIGIACTVIVTVTTWGFLTGKFTTSEQARISAIDLALKEFRADTTRRFDEAGRETSKAMTYVQGMELRFSREFANRDMTDERFAQNARDHNRFDADITILQRSGQRRQSDD